MVKTVLTIKMVLSKGSRKNFDQTQALIASNTKMHIFHLQAQHASVLVNNIKLAHVYHFPQCMKHLT